MLIIGFFLLAADVPSSLVAAADDANLAYTQCLFATSRAAHQQGLSANEFASDLSASCDVEERALEQASARILSLRGDRNGAVRARKGTEAARRQVVEDYGRAIQLGPELKAIAELCRAHPEQCRD